MQRSTAISSINVIGDVRVALLPVLLLVVGLVLLIASGPPG